MIQVGGGGSGNGRMIQVGGGGSGNGRMIQVGGGEDLLKWNNEMGEGHNEKREGEGRSAAKIVPV